MARRLLAPLGDVSLVAYTLFFLYVHLHHLLTTGHPTSVVFAAAAGIEVGFVLRRKRSAQTSSRPFDWTVAMAALVVPLLIFPVTRAPSALDLSGVAIQVIGVTISGLSFLSLGRSLGVVAADRGLKRRGMYRLVRHPIYLGHCTTIAGVVVANPSSLNVAIGATAIALQLLRIRAEERFLRAHTSYDAYAAEVRWRLLPGVY